MTNAATVVVFGADAIGRGLLGELVRAAGLDLVLVEANPALVEALRRQGHYQVRLAGANTEVHKVAGRNVKKLADIDFVTGTEGKWIDGKYMLVVNQPGWKSAKRQIPSGLYDIYADEAMKRDLTAELPEKAKAMRVALDAWRRSVRDSYDGKDYVKP